MKSGNFILFEGMCEALCLKNVPDRVSNQLLYGFAV